MSHVADVDIEIKDLAAAKEAAMQLGGEFMEGQTTHKWYGRFMNDWDSERAAANRRDPKTFGTCDHAIRFAGVEYEIGLCREENGSYTAVYDSWGPGKELERLAGVGLARFKDEYAAAVARRKAARAGFTVTRSVDANGQITLKARM